MKPRFAVETAVLLLVLPALAWAQTREQYEEAARTWRASAAASRDPQYRACAIRKAQFYECTVRALAGSGVSCTEPKETCTESASPGDERNAPSGTTAPAAGLPSTGTATGDALVSAIDGLFSLGERRAAEKRAAEAEREAERRRAARGRADLALEIERELERSAGNAALADAIERELAADGAGPDTTAAGAGAPSHSRSDSQPSFGEREESPHIRDADGLSESWSERRGTMWFITVRNISSRPIRLLWGRVYDCVEVGLGCGSTGSGYFIRPGEAARITTVFRATCTNAFDADGREIDLCSGKPPTTFKYEYRVEAPGNGSRRTNR